MANSIFIKADELAKELDISQGLAYKMIAQWNEEPVSYTHLRAHET